MKNLLKLAVRISKLNILILYPLQKELDNELKKYLGEDFRHISDKELANRIESTII